MVDLLPTEEHRRIIAGLSRYLDAELPARRLIGAKRDPALADNLWHRTAALGWFGLGLSEIAGGSGLSLVEEMLVVREFGRILAPPAFLAAVLGAKVADRAGDTALAGAIAGGQVRVAVSIPMAGGVTAAVDSDWDLFLLDGECANYILRVDEHRARLCRRTQMAIDPVCDGFDDSVQLHRAKVLADDAVVAEDLEIHRHALVLTAAYLAGICRAVQDMAVEYAKTREQFGQPIGTFQAIKHRCADMAVRIEAVSSQVTFAAIAVRDGRADSAFQAIAAKLVAGAYAILSAQENIQVHGAIGVTAEYSAHLYLKRAHVLDLCFGVDREQKSRLMACPPAQLRVA